MKSNSILLLILLLLFAAATKAQDGSAPNNVIVTLPDGGFVSFKNESTWIDLRRALLQQDRLPALGAQALTDRNQTVHRVLRDQQGRLVFGYDLRVVSDAATKQFTVAVQPLDPQLELRLRTSQLSSAQTISTFPKVTDPQTLEDGAEFSVDLLINQNTGVKIIDVVKVSFDRSHLGGETPAVRPRDFSLDAVAMEMKDYSLFVNQDLIATGKSKTGSTGALLWLYIPGHGRFVFSLVPRANYAFQKAGIVSANRIEFDVNGKHYEWLSSSPILREAGAWNLWVLADAKYSPLIGAGGAAPEKEKGTLEKLDTAINSIAQAAPVTTKPATRALKSGAQSRQEAQAKPRETVMFGAADRIENLLPRD